MSAWRHWASVVSRIVSQLRKLATVLIFVERWGKPRAVASAPTQQDQQAA
jgi:hypothetical protein